MNYSGNMPDWHQYNPPQSGVNDVTSTAQNVNSGHFSFISSISPTQLNSLNLNSEGHEKHQADPNFNSRHFQPHLSANISHGHNIADNAPPLTSMVQMQNCIGHYGASNTRNPMVDNLGGSLDPRNTAMGNLNEELGYRNNQVPLNNPISHLSGPSVMNMNLAHGSIGPRSANINSHAASRTGPPSFVPCKGLCCNPEPNMNYQQWEKYCAYQNNTTYRENIRSSVYQTDTRRFGSDLTFRKDNFDGKEISPPIVPNVPNSDHRRNFPDFKYRKDRLLPRSYPPSSGMLQNYPMQNYNYTGEYQKYPYNVKEYSKMNSVNIPNQGMVKHQELGFMAQQKYSNKQYQNGAMMPNGIAPTNVNPSMIPSAQNAYCFNPQYPRNLSTEASHDCQETADNVSIANRMQTSTTTHPPHPRYQMYQQKIAMQKFSMENHLKEMTRIPGYQSHPKYKECVIRYREILKLQQSVTCQGQMQQNPCVTASTVNASVAPINLQFDQNGVLINSNYMPEAFPRVQQVLNPQASVNNSDKQSKQEHNNIPEMVNVHKPEQLISQQHDNSHALCPESLHKQDRYPVQKNLDQIDQFAVQRPSNESFSSASTSASDGTAVTQRKISKKFADKPELDVRQFLANWDESEDEDSVVTNIPDIVLSDSTPVVLVGYENVDLSAKTLDGSKPGEIRSNVITFESQGKDDNGVAPAQDCLTISYSTAGNVEIAKDAFKQVPKESIVQSGSIIQCISNGPDEVPTIHIVDNLEIGNILQVTGGQVAETLEQQDAMAFFHEGTEAETSVTTLASDKYKSSDTAYGATEPVVEYNGDIKDLDKEKYIVADSCPPKTMENDTSQTNNQRELSTSSVSTKDNLDSSQDINLKKQSSFTSEESHNPDDISLPDLPTSECTPISTTLNTPIHSDSEESSERVEDLTISTNPIEVVQNSPIISFAQSSMRGGPYEHLNDDRNINKNKSDVSNSSEARYQSEDRFKDDGNNNMLHHDAVIGTFEFSENIDKSGESRINANDDEERRASPSGSITANKEGTSVLDGEMKNAGAARVRMILTSNELNTASADMQNKSTQDYKSSAIERRVYESQTRHVQPRDHKRLLTEAEATSRYSNSVELDKGLENIASDTDPLERDEDRDDIDRARMHEGRLSKKSEGERKLCAISSTSERRCISPELTCRTAITGTNLSTITDDTIMKDFRPVAEDGCSQRKVAKSDRSVSRDLKHSSLNNDYSRKNEATNMLADNKCARENLPLEKDTNDSKSLKTDAKNLKNSRHANNLTSRKKSASNNPTNPCDKKGLSENTAEKKRSGTIVHCDKRPDITEQVTACKVKSCNVGDLKESDISRNEPTVINNGADDNRERMRLLKEYRKMKSNSSGVGQNQNKGGDIQKADYEACEKYPSSGLDEQSVSRALNDRDLRQQDAKASVEQDKKHAILKAFVSKNVNPDFAIQVTNVNLKLKDNDDRKELQHLGEEAKDSGSLDAIKIEINVSCTERNTTKKLLHENIKNAVAETIGHLTHSISNGARSNSTEIQCDKNATCDKPDPRNYERYKRSLSSSMGTYNDARKSQNNTEMVKHKPEIIQHEEESTNDEASASLVSKKGRSLSSERESINNMYEDNDNINIDSELAPGALETSEAEQIKRRSIHQNAERKIIAANVCSSTGETNFSSDNPSYAGSTSKNANAQKERQDILLCGNARNLQHGTASRLNAGPSTSSNIADSGLESSASFNNFTHFDYNHFDVAPNENAVENADDKRGDRWRKIKKDDGKFSNFDLYKIPSGYINPIFFSVDEPEDLNSVPVYTTKDGKITYSPNPRFTYRELIMEARAKEDYGNLRESNFTKFPSFDCSKSRKVFKRNRDINITGKKREIDSVGAKSQFTMEYIDYLPNKSTARKSIYCAKTRTSHLEFFNDEVAKSRTNRGSLQHESKESNKKSIVDLSFLEKPRDADSECNAKYRKARTFANNLDYENRCNDSSIFDSNLFLEPKASCWEETMESVKSYSSHIDRRNNDNLKELNFSEIFAVQRQSNSFSFLSNEQVSRCDRKTDNNCNTTNETLSCTTCSYIDNLCLMQDDDSRCERSDSVPCNDRESKRIDNRNVASTADLDNKSPSMHDAPIHDECEKKQQIQSDETDTLVSIKRAQSCLPKATEGKIGEILEKDQISTGYVKEILTECKINVKDDTHGDRDASSNEDKCDIANADTKQSSVKVTGSSKSSAGPNNLPNELKCTEMTKESPIFTSSEKTDNICVVAKSSSAVGVNEITHQQVPSILADRKDKGGGVLSTMDDGDVSKGIYRGETNGQSDGCDRENLLLCKREGLSPRNVMQCITSRSLDEERNEPKLQKSENKERIAASYVSKDEDNEAMDNPNLVLSKPAVILNLHTVETEEKDLCDILKNEKEEQNISEFTVIKSIINAERKAEVEIIKNSKNRDNTVDPKLLCVGFSDCGIYTEDRCILADISEHEFTEDDSRVPMEWETSQIQEDAVNRLCSIEESSINFVDATDSLLDNSLSLSRSLVSKSRVLEAISEIESKSNESVPVVESSTPMIENMEQRDQAPSSSCEKVAYLPATDCNANTKMVPKLVIKKTEVSPKFITKINSSSITDNIINKSILRPSCQPKIPKMIIRNARSRPGTPSIEAVPEKVSAQANLSDRILARMAYHNDDTREELFENDSENFVQGSNGQNKNKIPKMKIKLDENHSNKIITTGETAELCVKRKNIKKTIPKVKIKTSSTLSNLPDNSLCNSATCQESTDLGKHEEKIPILKLRKQERNESSSPEAMRKRQNSSCSEVPFKKCKKLGREETGHSTRHSDSARTISAERETRKNPCVSEKIPKVIIKRTSANAEFKCELSKSCKNVIARSAIWQPEVKLERYRILDNMVKDTKSSLIPISLQMHSMDKTFANRKDNCRQGKKEDYSLHRLSRSNSTSELLPVKCKQRRMSDYDCRRSSGDRQPTDDVNFSSARVTDSKDTNICNATKKSKSSKDYDKSTDEYRKDDKCRSKSRDNNSKADVPLDTEVEPAIIGMLDVKRLIPHYDVDRNVGGSNPNCEQITETDENSISTKFNQRDILAKHSSTANFKSVLKELKETSKSETCFVKLPNLSEIPSEKIDSRIDTKQGKERGSSDDPFSNEDDKVKVARKKRLNSCSDMDNACTLRGTVLFKDDPASVLDNSEDSNSVIKIDSSDESQTTIEILPASPHGSNSQSRMIDDGDSEQLYPADAIPTQFELELEITDNSNIDLLDVSMPRLDSIACYSSRRVSTDENYSDQMSKTVECFDKSESLSRDKNSPRRSERTEIDISGNERSVSEKKSFVSIQEISSSPCNKKTNSTVMEGSFCCNDSLIKEVLAAKETLKKCFSKTGCESSAKNNARPKTAAEKKQGSGFDPISVSETHSRSNDALEGRCSEARLAAGSISTIAKHKTEPISNVEKSDKKHSKQSESMSVKKKLKPSEEDEGFCSTFSFADTKEAESARECTTISLKAFRRFDQVVVASSGNAIHTRNLNEKGENLIDQNDTVRRLRDVQRKEESLPCRISEISKSINQKSNVSNTNVIRPKEDNMPILEPETAVSFDANSDRDNSRSPPVITNQDSGDIDSVEESKLVEDKIVMSDDKVESNTKDIHKRSEMSISDFVTQLAYHEKATIKHRRYCNLCERWFPTASRHRRHLAGYQHRHIELTQRRSIHTLFMLFTGKPCPRLLPANVVRSDYSVGELTPLQVAVQDVARCFDHIQQSPKKQNDVDA